MKKKYKIPCPNYNFFSESACLVILKLKAWQNKTDQVKKHLTKIYSNLSGIVPISLNKYMSFQHDRNDKKILRHFYRAIAMAPSGGMRYFM